MTEIRGPVRLLSVAPMMERTDRHYRAFARRLTRRTLLYTEMITSGAVLHGDRERLLGYGAEERPLALQLGGDDPGELAACARIAADLGYDEVDLNVGCPSDRVRHGRFGVGLMREPDRVAAAVEAMRRAVDLPVTVKHRIGVDEMDRYEDLRRFVETVARAGCDRFVVHARRARLEGLSPKENRTVPPLRYRDVHRLKRELPHLRVEINGGVASLEAVREHLTRVDGVMIGRAAYDDPYLLAGADAAIFGESSEPPTRRQVVETMIPYVESWVARGERATRITRHMLGLFAGRPGARAWRRRLSERGATDGAGARHLAEALKSMPGEVLDEIPRPPPAGPGP